MEASNGDMCQCAGHTLPGDRPCHKDRESHMSAFARGAISAAAYSKGSLGLEGVRNSTRLQGATWRFQLLMHLERVGHLNQVYIGLHCM